MNTSFKRILAFSGAPCLASCCLIFAASCSKNTSGAQQGNPPDVEVVQVQQQDVPIYGEWIGTLDGLVNADVRAQVTPDGYIVAGRAVLGIDKDIRPAMTAPKTQPMRKEKALATGRPVSSPTCTQDSDAWKIWDRS